MKNYFRLLKDSLNRLRVNFGTMLFFMALYTIVGGVVAGVITKLMSMLALTVSGLSYVGDGNFVQYIASPVTIICIFISLLVVGYIQMVEIGGLIVLFEASGRDEKISLKAVLAGGIAAAVKVLKRKNWSIILFLMLLLPFLSITTLSTVNYSVSIPGFINDYMLSRLWGTMGILALNIILYVFAVKWILSLHVFVTEPDTHFKEAKQKSAELIKGKFFATVIKTLITGLLCFGIAIGLTVLLNVIIVPFGSGNQTDPSLANTIATIVIGLIFILLSPCINIAYLSAVYTDLKKEKAKGTETDAGTCIEIRERMGISRKTKGISWGVLAVFFVLYGVLFVANIINAGGTSLSRPEIAAHRGASKDAPENTMPAFELAVDQGVSRWIEFDVHQSKDGEIIICHDDHIVKPPTDITVHESTLPELRQVDVGEWFSEAFKGTRLSTLQEFLDYCRTNNIWLNLEIKPTKYDTDLVEKTMELVSNSGIEERIIISSLDSDSLKKVKEIDPKRTTLYNMVVASGDVGAIQFADWYGIEETNITEELVENIHEHGGKIFVWTVNQPWSMQYLIDCGVDGVNTDSPLEIEEAVTQADYHGGIIMLLRMLIHDPNFLQVFIY